MGSLCISSIPFSAQSPASPAALNSTFNVPAINVSELLPLPLPPRAHPDRYVGNVLHTHTHTRTYIHFIRRGSLWSRAHIHTYSHQCIPASQPVETRAGSFSFRLGGGGSGGGGARVARASPSRSVIYTLKYGRPRTALVRARRYVCGPCVYK